MRNLNRKVIVGKAQCAVGCMLLVSLIWPGFSLIAHQATLQQMAFVKASNPGESDRFGNVTAISGDTLVVGAHREKSGATGVNGDQNDDSLVNAGAVYIYVLDNGTWSQQAYLKASNTGADDEFGFAVAISGDTLVVGAPGEDSGSRGGNGDQNSNSVVQSGAAYVFVREGTSWSQQAYIKASNGDPGDSFGSAVAIEGDLLVIGASGETSQAKGINGDQFADEPSSHVGAVFAFSRDGSQWSQQAYIKPSNSSLEDHHFGESVALSGNTLAVGASGEHSSATGVNGNEKKQDAPRAGAVFVFTHDIEGWQQEAFIKASNTDAGDLFGFAIAISGDTLVVGAGRESSNATGLDGDQGDNSAEQTGAAYVFVRNSGIWSQQAYIKASNTDERDHFGQQFVAIQGDVIAIASHEEDGNSRGINGEDEDNTAENAGAVYLFVRNGFEWSQQYYLKGSNTDPDDRFGRSLAISDRHLVVGAVKERSNAVGVNGDESDNSIEEAGAVYVFSGIGSINDFKINPGLNDAWYNPETNGQGFFITVFPDLGIVTMAWFTYDTEPPPMNATAKLGDPGHRWLTAVGAYADNQAVMNIDLTSNGIFDMPTDVQHTEPPGSDGTLILIFEDCNKGTVEYDIPSINGQGIVPIQRVADDNIALCQALSAD